MFAYMVEYLVWTLVTHNPGSSHAIIIGVDVTSCVHVWTVNRFESYAGACFQHCEVVCPECLYQRVCWMFKGKEFRNMMVEVGSGSRLCKQ